MKLYVVRVTAYIPYPIIREYTQKAGSFAVAVNRAMREYKKEPRVARHRIKQMSVSASLGGTLAV